MITITFSALPCDDEVAIGKQQTAVISQGSDLENNAHIDLCSPFCSCACCTISISEPTNQTEILISPIIPVKELSLLFDQVYYR